MQRAVLVGFLLVLVGVSLAGTTPTGAGPAAPNPCVGTIERPPDDVTLASIQGTRVTEQGYVKTRARLLAISPNGSVIWVRDHTAAGRHWTYDVDPLPNGTLLVSTTEPGITVVEELNASTGDPIAVTRYRDVGDAHDVDRIAPGRLIFADKKEGQDRIVVYNRTSKAVVWEWRFENHPDMFATTAGGNYPEDWTHVNDVDRIAPGEYLVSVRNFDQVIAVDRETGTVELVLGEPGDHRILHRQHNPQFLRGPGGEPTLLVADSLNDRVVEYARIDGSWRRTWSLVGGGLNEPRDADRLPNGNTLVVDRKGPRLLEVTPRGEVVWEFYTPWEPYDAERYTIGDEPGGPTARELEATGQMRLIGSANFTTADIEACDAFLKEFSPSGPIAQFERFAGNGVGGSTDATTRSLLVIGGIVAVALAILAVVGLRLR